MGTSHFGSAGAGGSGPASPRPRGTRTEAEGLRDLGVRYEPAAVPPVITEAQAIAKARTFGAPGASLAQATQVTARYVLFSDDQFATKDAQGVRHPRYQRVPAWVVTFTGLNMISAPKGKAVTYSHEQHVVIDARTGEGMEGFSFR